MKYYNPVVSGFFPDPSVCTDGKKFYLVCSSFQYFPGVPIFESDDLINWELIGHCLTRESQLPLKEAGHSGGIFAPCIRYNEGRFYMITTNVSSKGNFFVYTDDIHGEWSEPVWLDFEGIDPSLTFADGKCYFTGNGFDKECGKNGNLLCEIDINTGKALTAPKYIWHGTGGRYLEGPHFYKIDDYYYIMAAEGGTEYGHMESYARSKNPYGPYEDYAGNPVLTNRNLGGYQIQGSGHADLIKDNNNNWWLVHLAFRQTDQWLMNHITGRETYLVPVTFKNGWFSLEGDGTTRLEVETDREEAQKQSLNFNYDLSSLIKDNRFKPDVNWCFSRNPELKNYLVKDGKVILKGNNVSIHDPLGSSTFIAIRQKEMFGELNSTFSSENGEGGITVYMDENHHYDVCVRKNINSYELVLRLCVGDIKHDQRVVSLNNSKVKVRVNLMPDAYTFEAETDEKNIFLGKANTKYVSTEVAGGFTGVMLGLYAEKEAVTTFESFDLKMTRN